MSSVKIGKISGQAGRLPRLTKSQFMDTYNPRIVGTDDMEQAWKVYSKNMRKESDKVSKKTDKGD